MNQDTGNGFKWVGSRPVRPDGVDKVTGRGPIRGGPFAARDARRGDPPQPPRPRPHPVHRHFPGRGPSRGEGGHHVGRSPRPPVGVRRPRAGPAQLRAYDPERHGAREGALRGSLGGGGGGHHEGRRGGSALPHRHRLRGSTACHRRRGGDASRRPAAPSRHVHARRRTRPGPPLQHRQARRVRNRRCRGGLPRGGGDGRDGVHDLPRPPGLHRAARLRRPLWRGRTGRDLGVEPGPLPDPRFHCPAPRPRALGPAGDSGRDRGRIRRQDGGVPRADRPRAGPQERPPGQARDDPGRGLQGHRPRPPGR